MASSFLLTAFLPDVTDSELCPALWSWFVALVGVRSGQYPGANLSLSSLPSVSPWVSLVSITSCTACVHKAVFRAAQQRASSHPISSHLISPRLISRSWHCLSMAISSRLALWEQKESNGQGSGCSHMGQLDPPRTSHGPGGPGCPLPPGAGILTFRASLGHVQSPFGLLPRLAMASPTQPGISDHALDSSHGCLVSVCSAVGGGGTRVDQLSSLRPHGSSDEHEGCVREVWVGKWGVRGQRQGCWLPGLCHGDGFLRSLPSVTMENWKRALLPSDSAFPFCVSHEIP